MSSAAFLRKLKEYAQASVNEDECIAHQAVMNLVEYGKFRSVQDAVAFVVRNHNRVTVRDFDRIANCWHAHQEAITVPDHLEAA